MREHVQSERQAGVVVLGMHRSGTSVASRLINMLGPQLCEASDLVSTTPWNAKGLWESRSMIALDDRILARSGYTWWYPPPDGPRYDVAMAGTRSWVPWAREVFARVHRLHPWVWKDPRASLLLPFWRDALGPFAGVLVYRSPLDVADSLRRRNDFALRVGCALWERYNRLLLRHCDGMPVIVLRYDDFLHDLRGAVDRLRAFLDDLQLARRGPVDFGAIEAFVDPHLRHSARDAASEPGDPEMASWWEVHRALESRHAAHERFVSPALLVEPPAVQQALDDVGPSRPPTWREAPR